MCRRRDRKHSLDDVFDTTELCHVQSLEGTFRMADEIDLGSTSLLFDRFDKIGDFDSGLLDRFESSNEWKARVGTICQTEGAEALGLEVGLEDVDVLVVCCAETMEENDGVGVCLAATAVVVVSSPFDDRSSCSESCRKNSIHNKIRSHLVLEEPVKSSGKGVSSSWCRLKNDSRV